MANKIILKKTSTASKVPLSTDLEVGEIAVNLADQKLYSKNASGTVVLVGQGTGGSGTVTSVGITPSTGVTVSGSPVTTSGNITVGLSTKLTEIENLSGAGFITQNGSGVIAGRTIQAGTGISVAHGNGSSQDPIITNAGVTSAVAGTGISVSGATGAVTIANTGVTSVNGVTGAVTATNLLDAIKTVDGAGSGLDADTLDGNSSAFFYPASNPNGYTTNTGTVTSVATGTGLTGGTITTSGTISLANTSVTAGSYTNANITVDAQGRITTASNGAGGGVTSITGTANEIDVSASTGAVTISLPATINANLNGNASTATSATSATTATTATNWGSYGGVPASGTSFATANTIGRSDANGYTYFNYINSNTSNNENPTVSQVMVTNGSDNFYRKASLAHVRNSLGSGTPSSSTYLRGDGTWAGVSASGVAKIWARYTPSNGSVQASKGVSSVSSGIPWTVNYSSALPNANYSVVVGNGEASGDAFARSAFISAVNAGNVQFRTPQNYPLLQCIAVFND